MKELCEVVSVALTFVCALSAFVGPALLISGGIVLSIDSCEVIEVVGVVSLRPAAHGIGLCDAVFVYYNAGSLTGSLTTPCPPDSNTKNNGSRYPSQDVAVCYSVEHPERYQAALLASDLRVLPRSVPVTMLCFGAAFTVLPIICLFVAKVTCAYADYAQHVSSLV